MGSTNPWWRSSLISLYLPLLVLVLSATNVDAAVEASFYQEDFYSSVTAQGAIEAVVLIITGLALCFAGFMLFRPVLFLVGFYFFAAVCFIVLSYLEGSGKVTLPSSRSWIYLVACLAAGVIGGLVSMAIWRLGLGLLGGLLGLCFALFILMILTGGPVESPIGRVVLMGVLTAIGVVAIFLIEKPLLIASTSLVGSFAFFFGIDMFARTGFSNSIIGFFKAQPYPVSGWVLYAILIGWFLLALAGSAVQSNYGSGGRGMYPYSQFRNKKWREVKPQWEN
ncbi:hypothetical protein SmJEL517_g04823 [Synchytrium microbalum]|uniref:Transmembrane protein 198 n=1 Tax=Synchytrium microbalum TaxID=1806994 RepID=A0A507C1Q0_9FUNG|nr:uncharacterized protein SmJEL517_g04823 [Synchytrium microbalum]TPX32004.1 hypothetical protein SmJEL517_g04823 [Synchytrium microbalum]